MTYIHFRVTPKNCILVQRIQELASLKNNYLDQPLLSLVRSTENIDEIWAKLKTAFGDPKMMISEKLAQIKILNCCED